MDTCATGRVVTIAKNLIQMVGLVVKAAVFVQDIHVVRNIVSSASSSSDIGSRGNGEVKMQTVDVGNKILLNLYEKYFQGAYRQQHNTEGVVKELNLSEELHSIALKKSKFLKDDGQIHGEAVLGLPYPKFIRIEPYGIDNVERLNEKYSELHNNVRLKLLARLYEWYFEEHGEQTILVDAAFVQSLGFDSSMQNLVFGDVTYLNDKHLIQGYWNYGHYPYRIKINSDGINFVERFVDRLGSHLQVEQSQELATRPDTLSKLKTIRNWVSENPEIVRLVINIFKDLIT